MDNKEITEKLQSYNNLYTEHNRLCRAKDRGQIVSFTTHIVLSLLFFVGIAFWADDLDRIFYNVPTVITIICILLYLFVIPLLIGFIAYFLAKSKPLDPVLTLHGSPEEIHTALSNIRIREYYYSDFYIGTTLVLCLLCCGLLLICGHKSSLGFGVGMFIVRVIYYPFQKLCFCSDRTDWWKTIRYSKKKLNENWEQYKQEKERAEAERKQRILQMAEEEAARLEEERRIQAEQRAIAAECEFTMLEDPASDESTVQRLADVGSPSACLYIGRKLHEEYFNEQLTKKEKEALAASAISYLKTSADTGNIEGRFLLLFMRTATESHSAKEWLEYLQEARIIKSAGELSEVNQQKLYNLIDSMITVIDKLQDNDSKDPDDDDDDDDDDGHIPVPPPYTPPSGNCRQCRWYMEDVDLPHPVCTLKQFHFEHDFTPCGDFER